MLALNNFFLYTCVKIVQRGKERRGTEVGGGHGQYIGKQDSQLEKKNESEYGGNCRRRGLSQQSGDGCACSGKRERGDGNYHKAGTLKCGREEGEMKGEVVMGAVGVTDPRGRRGNGAQVTCS